MVEFLMQHRTRSSHSCRLILVAVVAALTIGIAAPASAKYGGIMAWGAPILGDGGIAGSEVSSALDGQKTASVHSVQPSSGPVAGDTTVTITGSHFTGATAVMFGANSATSFTVDSGRTITAVSPAGTGTVNVTVTTPEGTSRTVAADKFSYEPPPTVTNVSPDVGPETGGTSVTITGTNLTGASTVDFGATAATSFSVSSASSITAVAPAGTGTTDVTVTTAGGTSEITAGDKFVYLPPPEVTSVLPREGPEAGATSVTITGTNLGEATSVRFGAKSATSFTVDSESTITAVSPAGMGTVDVTVTTPWGTSTTGSADDFVYETPPVVKSVAPKTGPEAGGTTVTIRGTSLASATAVRFGSTVATSFKVNSPTSIAAVSPAGAGTVDVTVTTPDATSAISAADDFTYMSEPQPTVEKVHLKEGPAAGGTQVTITGTNFTGATAVEFGSTSASFTVESHKRITAIAPGGTGTVDVTVTTPVGTSATSAADHFTYVPPGPVIEAIPHPRSREQGGRLIAIEGTGFTGATAVDFGAASAISFKVISSKRIIAYNPSAEAAGEAVVNVTVTTPEGTSPITTADRFTYNVGAPIITSISASKGPAAGGTIVGIGGENFIAVTAVDFGSVSAASFTVNSSGSIMATSPAETVGKVDVTVTTPEGVSGPGECTIFHEETGPERVICPPHEHFTFVEPTVTSVTPDTGSSAGGTVVTITGSGFGLGTTATVVEFGSTPATSVECTSIMTCTLVTPARKAGTVDVKAVILTTRPRMHSNPNPPADQFTYE